MFLCMKFIKLKVLTNIVLSLNYFVFLICLLGPAMSTCGPMQSNGYQCYEAVEIGGNYNAITEVQYIQDLLGLLGFYHFFYSVNPFILWTNLTKLRISKLMYNF